MKISYSHKVFIFQFCLLIFSIQAFGGGIEKKELPQPEPGKYLLIGKVLIDNNGYKGIYKEYAEKITVILTDENQNTIKLKTDDKGLFYKANLTKTSYALDEVKLNIGIGEITLEATIRMTPNPENLNEKRLLDLGSYTFTLESNEHYELMFGMDCMDLFLANYDLLPWADQIGAVNEIFVKNSFTFNVNELRKNSLSNIANKVSEYRDINFKNGDVPGLFVHLINLNKHEMKSLLFQYETYNAKDEIIDKGFRTIDVGLTDNELFYEELNRNSNKIDQGNYTTKFFLDGKYISEKKWKIN
jgi:hypothetical protein